MDEAKALGINLSQTLEQKLKEVVGNERARRWAIENREALKIFNDDIEENGLWSDGLRQF